MPLVQRSRLRHAGRSRALRPRARADGRRGGRRRRRSRHLLRRQAARRPAGGLHRRAQGADRADQPQSDEAGAARRQDPARGARGDAASSIAIPTGSPSGCRRCACWRGRRRRSRRWRAGSSPARRGDARRRRSRSRSSTARARSAPARCRSRPCRAPGSRSARGERARRARARRAGRGAAPPAGAGDRPHRGSGARARPALPRGRGGLCRQSRRARPLGGVAP